MFKPIFAFTVAGLISADAQAQDSSLTPGQLAEKNSAQKVDTATALTATPKPTRTIVAPTVNNPRLTGQNGIVPGPLRGGTVNTSGIVYDNGDTDGSNGYSNATINVFGARRTLLDDFTFAGSTTVAGLSWTHVWGNGSPAGTGTTAEIDFRSDSAGTPGAVIGSAGITGYTETETGSVFFSRPEILSCATMTPVNFSAGTYWHESTVVGAENNFWLVKSSVTGAESWTNYDDFGGLNPGSYVFGVAADLNFKLDDSGCPCVPKGCSGAFYDNGPTDGSNGYSNATINVFGARRTLLDDFNLGGYTNLKGMRWTHIWGSGAAPGFGTGAELSFRADASGTPGAVSDVANVTDYKEVCTGNVFFSRPEAETTIEFDQIQLDPGSHWLEALVVGADNNFWMVKSTVSGSECWVNYDDFGGLNTGSYVFGTSADLNFCLQGAPASCVSSFYDNGETDGTNGYSNATINVFGARRTLLDDFSTTGGTPSDISWTHVWGSGSPPPFGTGAEVLFRSDSAGTPGAALTGDIVTGYSESATGNVYFSRPEAASIATLASPALAAGTYWFEGTVVGADNNFWLVQATVTGSECWTNYDDFGGLNPGSYVFGVSADLNFCLGGGGGGPMTYCDPSTGSNNNTATISASSSSLGSGVTIDLAGGPTGQFCYLLIGNGNNVVNQPPGSKGDLCVVGGGCLGRYAKDIGQISGGAFSTNIQNSISGGANYGIPTCGGNITAGQTWNFQYWHRQPMGQPSTFSQAISVTFTN